MHLMKILLSSLFSIDAKELKSIRLNACILSKIISKILFTYPVLLFIFSPPFHIHAVVIIGGNGTGNSTAPVDDPGFANVGRRFAGTEQSQTTIGTGVYLGGADGRHWVLSAFHIQSTNQHWINLGEMNFQMDLDSRIRLRNPVEESGRVLSPLTDLALFEINGNPNLPRLNISQTPPSVGSVVTLIGAGWTRAPEITGWIVNTNAERWDWRETATPPADVFGYKRQSPITNVKRWGNNVLISSSEFMNIGLGDYPPLQWRFDFSGGDNEAAAVTHDSGGGVFFKNGDEWELSGIILTAQSLRDFPNEGIDVAIFGLSQTAADLAFYRDQIYAITNIPEPFETSIMMAMLSLYIAYQTKRKS